MEKKRGLPPSLNYDGDQPALSGIYDLEAGMDITGDKSDWEELLKHVLKEIILHLTMVWIEDH